MKSKYKTYPSYKDSGVEWLGEIPNEWHTIRGKFLFFSKKNLNTFMQCDTRLSLTLNGVIERSKIALEGLQPEKFDTYQVFNKDNLVFKLIDLENKQTSRVGYVHKRGIMSPAYIRLERSSDINIRFAYYLYYRLYIEYIFNRLGGDGVRSALNAGDLLEIPLQVGSLQEQKAIADYLDKATAKIDTLISKQTKLIELLKEKRQVVISTAVTRGLDSSVAMKDTGIEWLGEIPEHWRLPQISRILILMEQGKSPECDSSNAELDEWGVLKTSCVNNAIYDSEKNKTLPSSIKPFTQYEVKEEDILMSRASGSIDLIGSVAYVYKTRAKILLSDKIFRLYVDNSVNKIFFTYLMASDYMRTNIKMAISGGEGMANNIAKSSITRFKIALPPIKEQKTILIYIDKITTKIDNLITKSTKAIALLKEKRTALVSSAVTGKIDVRKAS